jgi:alpha-L-rhamnosidase
MRTLAVTVITAILIGCQSTKSPVGLKLIATDFGAIGDGTTLNTLKLQSAIDDLASKGGGTLVIPQGTFLTGALFLKPGVNLCIDKDGILKGSNDIKDYPPGNTRIEGHFQEWTPALINADSHDNLRIWGEGTIDGNGEVFWKAFRSRYAADKTTKNLDVPRPRLLFIQNSNHVRISNLRFKNSGYWNIHLYRCSEVIIDKVDIRTPDDAPSSDGIDIDSSQHVLVRDSYIENDDDCIALKGTKGPFAMQDASSPPVEHVRVQNCTFAAGHGVLTCGSEATIVRDVSLVSCRVIGTTSNVLRLKLRTDTPQLYEDIHLRDITLDGKGQLISIQPWSQYHDLKGEAPPTRTIRNVSISGVQGKFGAMGIIKPNEGDVIEEIMIKHVDVELTRDNPELQIIGKAGVTQKDVRIKAREQ